MIKELTREQKKIIYITAVAAAFIILFWALVYAPQGRRLSDIKNKLSAAESQIADISRLSEGRDLGEVVTDLNKRLIRLSAKLPFKEEDVPGYLSKAARGLKIEVKNMDPAEKRLLDEKIPGYTISELPVALKLSGEFKALGEYLEALEDDASILVQVRKLKINSSGAGNPKLDADLELSCYLLQDAAGK